MEPGARDLGKGPFDPPIYLITDREATGGRPLIDVVDAALAGGIRAVQLRERGLTDRELLERARELRRLTAGYGARLLVNDRIDVALACDADGVHLPSHSFRPDEARTLLGPDKLVGVSTHHVEEAAAAEAAGADFVVFGPIWDTPSKRLLGKPHGIEALRHAAASVRIPMLAIGGVDDDRLRDIFEAGAAGAAVIRAVLSHTDVRAAAQRLTGAWGALSRKS